MIQKEEFTGAVTGNLFSPRDILEHALDLYRIL